MNIVSSIYISLTWNQRKIDFTWKIQNVTSNTFFSLANYSLFSYQFFSGLSFNGLKSNYIQISYGNSYPSASVWNSHLMDTVYEIDWVNNSIHFTYENFTNWDNYNWINIIFSYQIFAYCRVAKIFFISLAQSIFML